MNLTEISNCNVFSSYVIIYLYDLCNLMCSRLMDQTPSTSSLKLQQLTATSSPFEYVKAGAAVRSELCSLSNSY